MTPRHRIATLAEEFSLGILEAIRSASLEELLAEAPRGKAAATSGGAPAGRPRARARGGRRSPEQIAKVIDGIVATLKEKPGLRSEELQQLLSLPKNEIVRPITLALDAGKIRKTGQKRATRYFKQ